jgi:hypothetical protein
MEQTPSYQLDKRLKTTTDFNEITEGDYNDGCYIIATNNRSGNRYVISDEEEYESFSVSLQQAYAWKSKEDRAPMESGLKPEILQSVIDKWDITEGSDIQMVNKKNEAGSKKPPTNSVPPIAILALGAAMQNGADKYGSFNWRESEVTASVFYNAMQRHLLAWWSGEDHAEDSKVHHLAHLSACCAILLDSELSGVFKDDRSKQIIKEEIFKKNG